MSRGAERLGSELFDPHGGPGRSRPDSTNPLPVHALGNPEFEASTPSDPSGIADHLLHIRVFDNGHSPK